MLSTQKECQTGETASLKTMWFTTHLGARYEMPDMLREHITGAHKQLDAPGDNVTVINISEAVILLPKRIINRAGVGDRCFWESK